MATHSSATGESQGENADPKPKSKPTFEPIKPEVELDAIDALFKDGLRCKLCELYTLVYDMATQRGTADASAALYDLYRRRMPEAQAKLSEAFAELLADGELDRSQSWLERVVALLEGQARFVHILVHGFEYLDRYYVKGDAKKNIPSKPTLREISSMCYEEAGGLRDFARRVKAAFTDAVCDMAERRNGAASWKLVRAFATSWRRLFASLLGPDWHEECSMQCLLEQHRHASLVRFATSTPQSTSKSIWTPELVGMIMEFISDADELHAAYGLKHTGSKSRPIIPLGKE